MATAKKTAATQNVESAENKDQMTEANKDLQAENEALRAELEAMKTAAAEKVGTEASAQSGPKMVKLKLTRSKEQKEDVFVSVNFRTYQIQRGVEVEVPDFVYEVLQHQEEMLEQIMLFEEKVQNK